MIIYVIIRIYKLYFSPDFVLLFKLGNRLYFTLLLLEKTVKTNN